MEYKSLPITRNVARIAINYHHDILSEYCAVFYTECLKKPLALLYNNTYYTDCE